MGHNGFKALAAAADAMSKGRAGLGGRALRVRARRTGVGRTCRRMRAWWNGEGTCRHVTCQLRARTLLRTLLLSQPRGRPRAMLRLPP